MKRDPAELLAKLVDLKLAQMHVACPAVVTAYYAPGGINPVATVDVSIPVSSVIDLDEGALIEALPNVPNVPIGFPRFGGYIIAAPVLVGDTGLLVFTDFSIDAWRATGQAGAPQNDYRTHSLGGAVFLPGLSPDTKPNVAAPTALTICAENGTSSINLGSFTPADAVALGSKVLAELTKISTELGKVATSFAAGGAEVAETGAVTFTTPYVNGYSSPSDPSSTVVKAT